MTEPAKSAARTYDTERVDDLIRFEAEIAERDAAFHHRMARTNGVATAALLTDAATLAAFGSIAAVVPVVPAAVGFFTTSIADGQGRAAYFADLRAEMMRETPDEVLGPQNRVSEAQPQGVVGPSRMEALSPAGRFSRGVC